jgi:hypothetical protein
VEVFFGVDADGVEVGGLDVDGDAVFEEAELLEAFGVFERAVRQGGEALEGGFAIGVETDVLPVLRCGAVAVVWDGGAREVEGVAIGGGDDFYGVGVGDVFGGAENFEGGDLGVRVPEGAKQGGEVLRLEEGFVALDVDVDVGVDVARYGVDAVGAAGEVGRGELDGPVVAVAEVGDFVGVGGDEDAVELRAGGGSLEDPGEHGAAGDGAEDLAGETRGGQASRNNAEDGQGSCFTRLCFIRLWSGFRFRPFAGAGRRLFGLRRIKYDWDWLCRGDRLSPQRVLCRHTPYTHRRCSSDG